jgi:hypothetical protein
MANPDERTITAVDLLHRFLELRGYTPDLDRWSEECFNDNPPRLYRLRQLKAIFRAFEIPWDPAAFMEGKFFLRDSVRYAPVLERAAAELPETMAGPFGTVHQLPKCFEILLEYREKVERALAYSSGFQVAAGLYAFAVRKTRQLNRVIRDNLSVVDDVLTACISPEAMTFTIDELARSYGYPDVDLHEIDADWW